MSDAFVELTPTGLGLGVSIGSEPIDLAMELGDELLHRIGRHQLPHDAVEHDGFHLLWCGVARLRQP